MSQYHQYIDPASTGSPQTKSGAYDATSLYDIELYNIMSGNDILVGNDIFHSMTPTYGISPDLASSVTTPSLIYDTPQELNDSPLISEYFSSPPLEPAMGFFPDLTNPNATSSLIQLVPSAVPPPVPSVPSVTIPVDDSPDSPFNSPLTTASVSTATSPSVTSSPTLMKSRSRKRSASDLEKDTQQLSANELALKRAKNTDAARRSRLRKVKKMESLESQVAQLKTENTELQTRIAVLESEKKGLEGKDAEKEARIKMLEQQLAEAHERLINRK